MLQAFFMRNFSDRQYSSRKRGSNQSFDNLTCLEDKVAESCVVLDSLHIVVTDINQHVRNFLQRELEKEGYTVHSVKTGSIAWN